MARVTGVAPFFLVADVTKAAEYYRDKLGFRIIGYFFEEPPVFAMVGRDDRIVMLSLMQTSRGGPNRGHKGEAIDAYLWVDDVDSLYAEFRQNGADILGPPQLRIYGMKELEVRDLDGYVLCFGQDLPGSGASGEAKPCSEC
ncbi:MAG: VOC family protein [Alphaproteobacteria bacterium]|nr:VOC family protein [Alphaproteobacteria bacterium]